MRSHNTIAKRSNSTFVESALFAAAVIGLLVSAGLTGMYLLVAGLDIDRTSTVWAHPAVKMSLILLLVEAACLAVAVLVPLKRSTRLTLIGATTLVALTHILSTVLL